MKAKSKKVAIGIAALLSVTFGVTGAALVSDYNGKVSAESVAMTVDTIGTLGWNKVDGAVGYKWSYAVNGSSTVVDGGETLKNSANVATALQAAVDHAKALNSDGYKGNDVTHAGVSFTVTPILYDGSNGKTQEYVHKFKEYVDYRYTTTDVSEYMTADERTLPGYDTPLSDVKFYKNDVFTFALYADKTETNTTAIYRIGVGGDGGSGNPTKNNYSLQLYANGSTGWRTYLSSETIFAGKPLNSQTKYYFSYAVFDTYKIGQEDATGETVYLRASTYNEETRSFELYHEIEKFYSTADIQTAQTASTPKYFGWSEDGDKITISAYAAADRTATCLSTGDEEKIIKDQLSKEVGFAMDEFNTLSWNETYHEATGYQWTYTVGDTTSEVLTTDTSSVNVLEALQAASAYAKENALSKASVTFTVTPILRVGKAVSLTYDYSFTEYYGYSGATTDVREYMTADDSTLPSYTVPLFNKFFKNNVVTFALYTENEVKTDSIYLIGVGGDGHAKNNKLSNYFLMLYRNGTTGWKVDMSGAKTPGGAVLAAGTRYYFSFAVFDTYQVGQEDATGETVYLRASTYNEETQSLELYHEIKQFYSTADIQTAQANGYYFGWNEDGDKMTISAYSRRDAKHLSTGSLSKILSAEAGLNVDAFNILSWNEVDGAVGYKWTYTVGDTTSEVFTTDTNSVNVLEALQEASAYATTTSLSKASVTFTVTPILRVGKAVPLTYDYSFTEYYGYSGATADVREYMTTDERTLPGTTTPLFDKFFKNNVVTFSLYTENEIQSDSIYMIGVGGAGNSGSNTGSNYRLMLYRNGSSGWRVFMSNQKTPGGAVLAAGTRYYFSFAVFDTYQVGQEGATGETVYLRASTYNEETQSLELYHEIKQFYSTADIQTAQTASTRTHFGWNESGDKMTISAYKRSSAKYLSTGVPGYVFTPEYDTQENGLKFTNKDFYEIGELTAEPNTIEVELKVPQSFSTSTKSAGAVFSNAVGGYGLTLEVYEKGVPSVTFYATDGKKYRVLFDQINVATGYWMHLTITHDKDNNVFNAYVDGKFIQAGQVVLASDSSAADAGYFDYADGIFESPFFLGSDYNQERNNCFQGSVRSLAVYSDVRTAEEISQDYANGVAVADSNLVVAYETLNVLTWEDIPDLSANGQTMNYYYWEDLFFTEKETVTDYKYSFAVVGDPQIITNNDNLKKTRNLDRLYDWIIGNKESKKIQYVFTLGDIVNYNNEGSWTIAKDAISQLDGVLPYSIIRGNHDNADWINQYFYYDAYTNQFAGFYQDGKLENSWRTFTVENADYLILNLDYKPQAAVLAWAGDIIEAFPDHKVIITTHYYLTSRGNLSDSGQLIWDNLASKYGNVFLVMGGHVTAQKAIVRYDEGIHGNKVTQMLINPQNWDTSVEETGMVVMLYFKNDGTIEVEEYSTLKQAYFREENQYVINELSPVYTAHNFGDWVQDGDQQTRTCEDCGHTETQVVPPESEGALQGDSKVKAISLTLDGTIGVNFYIQLSTEHAAQIANAKLKIVCGTDEQILTFPEAHVGGWADGLYKFTYYVAAKDIDVEISVQLMLDGEAVGGAKSYTVRDYINIVKESDSYDAKTKALVTALQDYCEAAAVCHNVDNATITDSSRINAVENTVFDGYGATITGENAPKIAITLLTESTTTLRIYVGTTEKPTIKANGVELEVTQAENGYYYADLTGIDAFSLAKAQTFTINDTVTVKCSALTYGKVMDTTNTDLVNVMKALYRYSQAATEYKKQ